MITLGDISFHETEFAYLKVEKADSKLEEMSYSKKSMKEISELVAERTGLSLF